MGCTASRLENEDTVRRCKERRRLIKEVVLSRHQLASAHFDYLRALRLTGAALTRFAKGEPLAVSEHTPPILLHSSTATASVSVASFLPPPTPLPHPPPPPITRREPFFPSPSPSPTITSSKVPHILSASSNGSASFRKPPPPVKTAGAGRPGSSAIKTTYANTPSQSSSAWDWENFYPPSPPDSEYFDRRKAEHEEMRRQQGHHLPHELEEVHSDEEHEVEKVEEEQGREEIHCRDWDQHYASTTSSSTRSDGELEAEDEDDDYEERRSQSTYGGFESSRAAPSEIGSSVAAEIKPLRRQPLEARSPSSSRWKQGREEYFVKADNTTSSSSDAAAELKLVVRHHDLAEIVAALEEYFAKEADAGAPVSDLLEIGRAQLERSFRQLKRTVYHSNSLLSSLSSSWTSKPPLAIKYKLDTEAFEGSAVGKSHGSTLERLLAWEKKLYEEVKAREGVKIEHEKKLSTLQSLEYRGKDEAKMDKTKASINKLQSLILVTSQAATTTSSAISRLRDDELAPQLVEICYGLLKMWRQMNQFHEVQNHIVQQVRGLVARASAGESTSDLHRLATRDLEAAVASWHSSFGRIVRYQREYVRSLYGWLKLTLIQVSSDNSAKDDSSAVAVELTHFCDEWKQALDRLPDTVASEAIKSFMNVVHVIYTRQAEELKIKKCAETYSKELEKKSASLRNIEKKYYQSYSMVGIGLPGGGRDDDQQVYDSRDPLAEKKLEIAACRRKLEVEMANHAKAIGITRSMTLNNVQTGLPGVFQAMTGFSGMFVEALEVVCRRAGTVS